MNYIISVINPDGLPIMTDICDKLTLPMTLVVRGRGTATQNMLDLLGIESNDRRVVLTVAGEEKTKALLKEQRRQLYIGVPGRGIVITIPIKSIGGGKTVAFLNPDEKASYTPTWDPNFELILAIANEGTTDLVMNAARSAGATGGTVLHGKGTGSRNAEKFYNVSIANEKEIVLIVAKREQKAAIMHAILKDAGPASQAGTITFSLPVSAVAGIGNYAEEDEK